MNLHFSTFTSSFFRSSIVSYKIALVTLIVSMLFTLTDLSAQANIERTLACSCIDNNAPDGQAQFEELITVNSAVGDTWYILSVSGLYRANSPVPPAAPFTFDIGPAGDTLIADGAGNYSLSGILYENLGYSISLTNDSDTVELNNILCEYPYAELYPDDAICDGETVSYTIENPNVDYSYEWAISGQGSIIGATNGTTLVVDWDDTGVGTEELFLYTTGQTGCSSSQIYSIVFEEDLTLACNDNINHAVSSNCIIQLSPDDILEDMQYNDDSYEITLTNPETGEVIPQGALASDVLFDTLEYSIEHLCSGNSCWGNIIFEDKYVPPLQCINDTILCNLDDSPYSTGFPLPSTATVFYNGPNEFIVENFDPCGDASLIFEDSETPFDCSFDYISIISREWTLTDFSGYTSNCTQLIYKTRTTIDDVIFPGDWDGVTNPVLSCDGNYPVLPSGYPDPIYTGEPYGGICDHMNVSYTDLISVICGATYKVVRKWKVYDECADTSLVVNQLIKIEDSEAPNFFCPQNQNFYIENTNQCNTTITTPFPNNIYDCSNYELTAEIVKVDQFDNIIGLITEMDILSNSFRAYNRELGRHRITYYAIDECGNESQCSFFAKVYDNVPPTAVCDQSTTIALDNEGTAIVPVATFDNGSFDNCSIDIIEVSRGPNDCGVPYGYSDHIELCCADSGNEVMVTLRVTDMAGNVNTCMVMVTVQDKKAPVITCPQNQTITCDSDYSDLSIFGIPTVTDNCDFTLQEEPSYQLNSCGIGTIYRKFTAIDDGGNESVCTQIINVINGNPLSQGDINWPNDYSTSQCISPDLHPDQLPNIYSYPVINPLACSEIGVYFNDQVFTNVNGSCKSIFRTWQVIDNCTNQQYNYTQKLYITDNEKPVFDECSDKTITGIAEENCNYFIDYSKTATDQCTSDELIDYDYHIDLNNNGSIDISNFSNTISESLPAGIHRVIWYAYDECNNQAICEEIITIEDEKKPTPYCLGGISTVIMPSTGTIAIWASDFNLASEDNCTPQELLAYSFSPDSTETSIEFSCDDLEGADEKIFELEIYVHDLAGNYDYCTANIRLTANNACDTTLTGTITFDGKIKTDDGSIMKDVNISLSDETQNITYYGISDENGTYAFQDLPMLMDYKLTANYEDDPLNGITTLDIVLIQKHILGIATLDSPYKVIAADVNESESISGADIVQLRKLILGHIVDFQNTQSWKFVDGGQIYPDPINPWPVNEYIHKSGDQSYSDQNFISVKMGDVNYSRSMSLIGDADHRTEKTLTIEYTLKEENNNIIADFSLEKDMQLVGLQFTAQSPMFKTFENIEGMALDINKDMILVNESECAFSWSRAFAQNVQGDLFTLDFGPTSPNNIILNNRNMKAEAYVQTGNGIEVYNVDLRQNSEKNSDDQLKVYQNIPNPFNESTTINFDLPKTDLVTLEIRNVEGLLLYTRSSIFQSGANSFSVGQDELNIRNHSGVLIYTLHTSQESVTMKMVAIQ